MNKLEKRAAFLDWFNNFLSVACFADYYSLTDDEARKVIHDGRIIHESAVEKQK